MNWMSATNDVMKANYRIPQTGVQSSAAFTIIELVVVIAVVALLIVLQLPALARAERQSRAAQCAGNLGQLAQVSLVYAHENHAQLPAPVPGGANWAWDLPIPVANSLIQYGATRNMFYCPANPDQNANGLWNWDQITGSSVRIIGYTLTFGVQSISVTNLNSSIIPQSTLNLHTPPPASKRVLLADVVVSVYNQTDPDLKESNHYTGIQGGYGSPGWQGHRTSHMNTRLPSGGNVAMLDGHVEWRPFAVMIPRTTHGPWFWW